ncbi:winged helix-turn-helix domain-containing protein [Pseudoalteromonas xiamenensis]|uniref:winged helix-turn-helix domain-containing protein n=1 Tax=Pseudoalteromonas xiamenensis TaxID=882626 RepID=UPI0027E3C52D|nr:winged helix-turn-helix domain-containing protein [Pseudoalteromonas xiamenensis]WMN58609.1 winged helix-turn-helix domain-containing protein [Pseudoalteromonas xiamenensis]
MNEVSFSRTVKEVKFGAWVLDPKRQTINDGEHERELEPLLFKILCYLMINNDRIVTRQDLVDDVWCQKYVDDNAINRAMSELRRVLKSNKQRGIVIKTHYRKGYSFFLERDIVYHDVVVTANVTPNISESRPQNELKTASSNHWYYIAASVLLFVVCLAVYFQTALVKNEPQPIIASDITVKYRENILSWLEGNYFLPKLHPSQHKLAFSYVPKNSKDQHLILRDLASGKEDKVALPGKQLEALGWSSTKNVLYYMSFKAGDNRQCELWQMDYTAPEHKHEKVMECDPNQLMVAGFNDKLIYERYGYRGNPELSVLVLRDLKTGDEFQITSPNVNSFGDKLLYFDAQNEKLYFERVQLDQSELFVTDIEGMEAQKLAVQSQRIWAANIVDGHFLAWFNGIENKFFRYDISNKNAIEAVIPLSNEDFYYAILMSDMRVLAFTEPREWDIYVMDIDSTQVTSFATNDIKEFAFTSRNSTQAYLAGSKMNRSIVLVKGDQRTTINTDTKGVKQLIFGDDNQSLFLIGEHFIKQLDISTGTIVQEKLLEESIVDAFYAKEGYLGLIMHLDVRAPSTSVLYETKTNQLISFPVNNLQWFGFIGNDKYVIFNSENKLEVLNASFDVENEFELSGFENKTYKHLFTIKGNELLYSDGYGLYQLDLANQTLSLSKISQFVDKLITSIEWSSSDNKLYIGTVETRSNLMLMAMPEQ